MSANEGAKTTETTQSDKKSDDKVIYLLEVESYWHQGGEVVGWFSSRKEAEDARDIANAGGYPELAELGWDYPWVKKHAYVSVAKSGKELKVADDFVLVPSPGQKSWVEAFKASGKVGRCENGELHFNGPTRPVSFFERHSKIVCQHCYVALFDHF